MSKVKLNLNNLAVAVGGTVVTAKLNIQYLNKTQKILLADHGATLNTSDSIEVKDFLLVFRGIKDSDEVVFSWTYIPATHSSEWRVIDMEDVKSLVRNFKVVITSIEMLNSMGVEP